MEGLSMIEFIVNQLLGFNGLVNLSNLAFLVAFSVRDVLYLRLLSVLAYLVILPFYYLQTETLWTPIVWGLAFIAVNFVRIILLMLERRAVVLSDEEENLHQLVFSTMDRRDFLKLLGFAEWVDYAQGEIIAEKGKPLSNVMIMITGEIEAILNDEVRVNFRPGELIGTLEVYGGLVNPADIVVRKPSKIVRWSTDRVTEFTASRPELRSTLQSIIGADLVRKLHGLAGLVRPSG